MKTLLVASLTLAILIAPTFAAEPRIQPVELTASEPIHWNGRTNETIDALQIPGPVSIRLEKCSDIVISACEVAAIELIDCQHITIRNSWIHDSKLCGVNIFQSQQVLVQGCRIENVSSGVYADRSQQIQVLGNFGRNLIGPFPRGQLAQFNTVTGKDNFVRGNYVINEHGKSNHEDAINIYMSEGEPDSPILVEDNFITGDPSLGSEGMSKSGSGIMLADCGGAYQTCRRNVVISGGQVGIGVAGGQFIRVEDNLIYGARSNVSNVGLYVWNQSGKPSDHVTVLNNRVKWTTKDGIENSWWLGSGVQNLDQQNNRFADATLVDQLPQPPSQAPMPPQPWQSVNSDGTEEIRLPWKIE